MKKLKMFMLLVVALLSSCNSEEVLGTPKYWVEQKVIEVLELDKKENDYYFMDFTELKHNKPNTFIYMVQLDIYNDYNMEDYLLLGVVQMVYKYNATSKSLYSESDIVEIFIKQYRDYGDWE